MKILLTGATGFVGRPLALRLRRDGHDVICVSRRPEQARGVLGAEFRTLCLDRITDKDVSALDGLDAVINLAGESVLGRWTSSKRRAIDQSRAGRTDSLIEVLRRNGIHPKTFISASAVGYYGDQADRELVEESPLGPGFLADVCKKWEAASNHAASLGARVVNIRIGVVLGLGGGALGKMLPAFSIGAGGAIGSGKQYFPWIHLDDLLEAFVFALENEHVSGPLNAAAPGIVRQKDFAAELASTLGQIVGPSVPDLALKVAFGDAAAMFLASHRVVPQALLSAGFQFTYGDLVPALKDLLNSKACSIQTLDGVSLVPDSAYLRSRRPRFVLKQDILIAKKREDVFPFFSEAENLGALTPKELSFEIITQRPIRMHAGTTIDYTIRLGPAPMRWRTEIERWSPNSSFVDTQLKGPYGCWWHEHVFEDEGAQTMMNDRVLYSPPLGPLGVLINAAFVEKKLQSIFSFRAKAIAWRFGVAGA